MFAFASKLFSRSSISQSPGKFKARFKKSFSEFPGDIVSKFILSQPADP